MEQRVVLCIMVFQQVECEAELLVGPSSSPFWNNVSVSKKVI